MMDAATLLRSARAHGLSVLLFLLMLVYPIPHTIALRNLLLIALLAGSAWVLRRAGVAAVRGLTEALRGARAAAWLVAMLTAWLVFQSALISPFAREALGFIAGDWLVALVVAATAIAAALAARASENPAGVPSHLLRALVLALFAHVAILLVYQGWRWLTEGAFPFSRTPFAEKDYQSVVVTALLGLLLPDLLARRLHGRGGLDLPAGVEVAMCIATCAAAVTLASRNAVIIAVCLVALSAIVLLVVGRRQVAAWLAPTVMALGLFGAGLMSWGLGSDARWAGFAESAAVAWQTEEHKAWLDPKAHPWPQTASGLMVEESAYLRLAWAKVAMEQVVQYPLGLGYGHKAFGWAVNRSYQAQTGHESSHSGLLDFTLANGIPGILLWLALSAALAAAGWRNFRRDLSPASLMLVFTVAAYFLRCMLDGHLSGFRLEMYALMVGALVAAMPVDSAHAPDPA